MRCKLPFWILGHYRTEVIADFKELGDGNYLVAFSSATRAFAYLSRNSRGQLQMDLPPVNRLRELLLQLRRQGIVGLCFDPEPDGSGGAAVRLAEVEMELSRDSLCNASWKPSSIAARCSTR